MGKAVENFTHICEWISQVFERHVETVEKFNTFSTAPVENFYPANPAFNICFWIYF